MVYQATDATGCIRRQEQQFNTRSAVRIEQFLATCKFGTQAAVHLRVQPIPRPQCSEQNYIMQVMEVECVCVG